MIRAILANHVSGLQNILKSSLWPHFIGVVLAVHISKILTGIMDFAFLGIFNKLAEVFSILKPFCS
jgi:membrane protein required for colicin V production